MRITINQGNVNQEELKSKLEKRFSQYKIKIRNKNVLVVEKSSTCAASIMTTGKDKMIVMGGFSSVGTAILFNLSFPLLGFLIPGIIYFAAFHSKMKKIEKEVGEYLVSEYQVRLS